MQTFLRQTYLVLALAAAMLVIGYRNLRNSPLDVFPEFAPPLVEIQTEAPGLSTKEVDSLVTVPLENALNGTANLKTIRSKSVLGLSAIRLIFRGGSDLMESRQLVNERLAIEASRLPTVAHPPPIGATIINDVPGLLLIVKKATDGQHAGRNSQCRSRVGGNETRPERHSNRLNHSSSRDIH